MAEIDQNHLKVLTRLFKCGFVEEGQIADMGVAELLKIPKLTQSELSGIFELQQAVKAGHPLAFLIAGNGESNET